jgi:hypothetical protein
LPFFLSALPFLAALCSFAGYVQISQDSHNQNKNFEKGSTAMQAFRIFFEEADSDEPRKLLGELQAQTLSDALDLAAQYYEIPQYDLVAVPVLPEQEPILHDCPYCTGRHYDVEQCPLKK